MPRLGRRAVWIRLAASATCISIGWAFDQQRPETAEERPFEYELIAKGVAGSLPLRVQFKSAPLRLEFRNLVVGRGESEPVPVPTTILMELRQGGVTATINGQKHERHQGDFWVVEKGGSLTIQNLEGVAVIRGIYIFEGNR
jgi:hypothetical protein